MKTLRSYVVASMVVLVPSLSLAAKAGDEGNSATEGAKSLSFAIPSGGNAYADGAFGLWLVNANMNIGINVGLAVATKPDTSHDVLLAPALRYYITQEGEVLPFYHAQVNLRLAKDADLELGAAAGLGVEWFVVKPFSIAGHVGLGLDLLRQGGSDAGQRIGTITSALTAQLYF